MEGGGALGSAVSLDFEDEEGQVLAVGASGPPALEAKAEEDGAASGSAGGVPSEGAALDKGSDHESGPLLWVQSKTFIMPNPDKESRAVYRQRALEVSELKPPKLCSKLTCMMPKSGKQSWCSTHRKVYENGKADADRQNTLDDFKKMGLRNDPDMDEFMDMYILQVGLPGQRCGQKAGDFDWHSFVSEKFAATSLTDSSRYMKMDHVAWIKYQTVERLKTREQAELEWAEAFGDLVKYPGRDFEGPGECPSTLKCKRPECAGGKLRLHVNYADVVTSDVTKGRQHTSTMGSKQRKKFTPDSVASADELLEVGHEQFAAADYSNFSKAVIARSNPFARAAPVASAGEDEPEDGRRNKKTRRASSPPSSTCSPNPKVAGFAPPAISPIKAISESIEDAHTKAETDVRRSLVVLRANLEAAAEALEKTPEATHTSRLRTGLRIRLEAAQYWYRDDKFIQKWCQGFPETGRRDIVDATGILTKKGEEEFTKAAQARMATLQDSLVASDLEGMYSRAELEDRSSDFASGSKTHEILESRKTDFSRQVEMMKEFSRLLQKAAQRLTHAHASEMKHQELVETKKKAEEDKKRAAEASAQEKASKKRKPDTAALADHAESVAKEAALAKEAAAAKDIWKIDFGSYGHPHVPALPLKADSAQVDWNMPFMVKDVVAGAGTDGSPPTAAEIECGLFSDKSGQYKSLLSAFRAGFPKAVRKTKEGRLGYGLPASEDFAAHMLEAFGLDAAVQVAPDVSGGPHPKAAEDLAKTLQPHIYGYNSNMKFTGCDPRQLSCVKFQLQGERKIACVAFHHLHSYMKELPEFQGKNTTYAEATAINNCVVWLLSFFLRGCICSRLQIPYLCLVASH